MSATEAKAIDTILHKGIRFKIRISILGFKVMVPMTVKPLYGGTVLSISRQRIGLKKVTDSVDIVWQIFETAENIKVFAKCCAVGILNGRMKIRLFSGILAGIIKWNLSVKEIHQLMTIVVTQMNAKDFFFTTVLVNGIQVMNREAPDTSEKKPSGEPLEKSARN